MKFRNLLKVVIAIVAVATVISCSKAEKTNANVEEQVKGHPVTVKFNKNVPQDGTKLSVTDSYGGLSVLWKAGDAISVVYYDPVGDEWHNEQFTLASGAGTYIGTFYNAASQLTDECENIRAYYPYTAFDASEKLVYNISAQTGNMADIGSRLCYWSMYTMNYDESQHQLSGANLYVRNNGFIKLKAGLVIPGFEGITADDVTIQFYGTEVGSSMEVVKDAEGYPTFNANSGASYPITIPDVSITNGALNNDVLITSFRRGTDEYDLTLKFTQGGNTKTFNFVRYIREDKTYNMSSIPAMYVEYSTNDGADWRPFTGNPFCYPPSTQMLLRAVASDGSARTYTFTSSNPAAIDVNSTSGLVTFKGAESVPEYENDYSMWFGRANITITDDLSNSKVINLCSNVYYQTTASYTGGWLDIPVDHTINAGQYFDFDVRYNANDFNGVSSAYLDGYGPITVESSNPAVATVSYLWGGPRVTGVAAGTADIIVHFGTVWSKKYFTVTVE